VGETSVLDGILSLGPVQYIGGISSGVYFLHKGITSLLRRLVKNGLWAAVAESWIFAMPLRIDLTLGIAALSCQFLDLPIL
jgi:peptidoglycan/LPS O-acetylase OafA/YrhL